MFSQRNEWLGFLFLGVKEARFINFVDYSRLRTEIKAHQLIEHQSTRHTLAGHESNPEEAMDFLSYVAEVLRGWDELNAREVGRMKSQPNAKGGMYVLNEDIDMKAKVAAMVRRLEELEMKKYKKYKPFLRHQCMLCLIPFFNLMSASPITMLHMATPTIQIGEPSKFLLETKATLVHTTCSAPQQASNLEQAIVNLNKVVGDFMGDQKSINAQLNQIIDSVEMEAQEGESLKVREVKAVINLRSGKEVDQPTSKPKHDEESVAEKEKSEEIKGKRKGKSTKKDDHDSSVDEEPERIVIKEDIMKKQMPPPFSKLCMAKREPIMHQKF
ncbi:hypothetical protein CK203_047019 [Vitis vinifera]|uniref:Uncharacterized protein n=1 Tax=Vitis vinifera TaxID=29760 RepID=A0A438FWK2_VITVI|nr:hypothetical protein CK203_047019 [Vitis vinifera]